MKDYVKVFDNLADGLAAMMIAVSTAGVGGFYLMIVSFQKYLSDNITEYLFVAFFAMVGQTSMWFIKFRYPNLFGKHEVEFKNTSRGTLVLYWFIDCFLAGITGVLFAKYLLSFIFLTLAFVQGIENNTSIEVDYHKLIVGSVLVGMFYETLIKKALKKKKELEKE